MNQTLVSEVIISRPEGVERMADVPLTVKRSVRGHTLIVIRAHEDGRGVTLRLSGAERIAFIEALGGTA